MRNALLWQLNYPQGGQAYLFGTMHVRDSVAFKYAQIAIEYINRCESFWAEIDLFEASRKIEPEDYLLPGALEWSEMIGSGSYRRMKTHCHRILDFDIEQWTRYYPMVVANKIAEDQMATQNDCALDAYLFAQAHQSGIDTGGLESVEFQIKLLKSLDINQQLRMLKTVCRKLTAYKKELSYLKKAYEEQDILGLYNTTRKSLGSLRQTLLKDRNMRMAQRIIEHPSVHRFYAVGAAHLAGPYGMLRILKQNSIDLHPLSI